jgi:general transcription factor 3C polypeptide 3 (transcription factor C subunit 4)
VVYDSSFGHSRNYCFASCFQGGRPLGPVLSHQVRALIGEGNQAYVDGNIPEAIRIMQEVIRIEPRASSAWSVIAQCYEDSNEPKKALQLRIMAAHLQHDADEWERLGAQSRWGRDRLSSKGSLTDGAFSQGSGL